MDAPFCPMARYVVSCPAALGTDCSSRYLRITSHWTMRSASALVGLRPQYLVIARAPTVHKPLAGTMAAEVAAADDEDEEELELLLLLPAAPAAPPKDGGDVCAPS